MVIKNIIAVEISEIKINRSDFETSSNNFVRFLSTIGCTITELSLYTKNRVKILIIGIKQISKRLINPTNPKPFFKIEE